MSPRIQSLSILVLSFFTCQTLASEPVGQGQVVEIGRLGDVFVRLRVLEQASLAHRQWITIEFENRGDTAVEIRHAAYVIDSERYNLATGKLHSSGGLASGNSYDLFSHHSALKPHTIHRASEQVSDYSSALLGLPSREGWSVKATIAIRAEVIGLGLLTDFSKRHSFQFQWLFPDEAAFERIRQRLRHLLENPKGRPHHGHLVACLLSIPEVAKAVSAQEILNAIDRREGNFAGRNALVSYLSKYYSDLPATVAYYRSRLKAKDRRVLNDLQSIPLWDESFASLLIDLYELDSKAFENVLRVFHRHHSTRGTKPEEARRLSAIFLKQSRYCAKHPDELQPEQMKYWSWEVAKLALTHDRTMIPLIVPFLDDKTLIREDDFLSRSAIAIRPPPLRTCDAALDAILTILEGNPNDAYRRIGYHVPKKSKGAEEELMKVRDRMILQLKERLSQGVDGSQCRSLGAWQHALAKQVGDGLPAQPTLRDVR